MNLKTVGIPKRQVGPREARWWQVMPVLDADLMGPMPYTPKDEKSPALSVFDASPHFPAPEAHLLACPATQH